MRVVVNIVFFDILYFNIYRKIKLKLKSKQKKNNKKKTTIKIV